MSHCSFPSVAGGVPVHNPQSAGSKKASRRNSCRTSIGLSSLGSSNSCDNGNNGSVCSKNGGSNKKIVSPQHRQGDMGQGGSKASGGDSHTPQLCKEDAAEAATSWYGHRFDENIFESKKACQYSCQHL